MKMKQWLSALAIAVVATGATTGVANAATESETDRYDISAAVPDTQINKNDLSMMDLKLSAGQEQKLTYYIQNKTKKAISFDISAGSATTTNLGQLDYTSLNDNLANSAPIQLGNYITVANSVTVQPETTASIDASVRLPQSASFNGEVAGGVAFHEKGTAASTTSQVALLVRMNDTLPDSKFGFTQTKLSVANRLITARIAQKANVVASKAKVTAKVISQDTGKTVYSKKKTVSIAPRSAFDFRVKTKVHDIAAGKYTVKVTVKEGDVSYTSSRVLTVTKAQAEELSTQQAGMTLWDWIKIILLAIVLFLIAFFAVRYIGSNKKKDQY